MTEKRLAQISVVLSTIIIMTYAFLSSYFLNKPLNLSSADLMYFALSIFSLLACLSFALGSPIFLSVLPR